MRLKLGGGVASWPSNLTSPAELSAPSLASPTSKDPKKLLSSPSCALWKLSPAPALCRSDCLSMAM